MRKVRTRNKAKELKKMAAEIVAEILKNKESFSKLSEIFSFTSIGRYSFGNTLLILRQKPEATYVAGLKTWNKLGRRVKKGEKGIAILAPIIVKVEEEGEERVVEKLVGFKTTYVWDISQTEGKALPLQVEQPISISFEALAREVEKKFGKKVICCPVPAAYGRTDGVTLEINVGLSESHKIKSLFHELIHSLKHFQGERKLVEGIDLMEMELEAEAGAMYLASRFGIDSSEYSIYYLSSWGRRDPEKMLAAIERGLRAAKEIEEKLLEPAY